jgi:hypothetical protein
MRLTKYQKAYLLEYMWNIHNAPETNNMGSGENTCWLQIDKSSGVVFNDAKKLLQYENDDIDTLKVLVVASATE